MLTLKPPRRSAASRRNHGGPVRTANLALERARTAREQVAEAPNDRAKLHQVIRWLLATCKNRPERTDYARSLLVSLLLGWTRADIAVRRDAQTLIDTELTEEAYR